MGLMIYVIIGMLTFFGALTVMTTTDKLKGKKPDFESMGTLAAFLGIFWGIALPIAILYGIAYGIYQVLRKACDHVSDKLVTVIRAYQKEDIC